MQEYIIYIDFVNSPGLGYKIFMLTERHGIDKISMEAMPDRGMALQFKCAEKKCFDSFAADLEKLEAVKSVTILDQMPYKEKESKLFTIINSVSEGIIAIDKDSCITHMNQVACKILRCEQNQAIGQSLHSLLGENSEVQRTLETGTAERLAECTARRGSHTLRFLLSSTPISSQGGKISGAVITIQDFKQIEKVILAGRGGQCKTFEDIVHQSPAMERLITVARMVARSSSTVLLRGESGVGKEVFAQAIHMEGLRSRNPFIPVNCSALTESLLESELFGYEEGAFTGALKGGKKGLFEQASGGTLFLDEIGDITLRMQVRLLRVLQEGTIRRIGGNKEIGVEVRIIAATNRNLEQLVQRGQFREDLYYRLNVIPLVIPPLRERQEDIPLLAQHLIQKICSKLGKAPVYLAKDSIGLLLAQDWPGNVRQLENTLERLINLLDTAEIQPEHIAAWADIGAALPAVQAASEPQQFQVAISLHAGWPPLREIVAKVEKAVVKEVLTQHPSSRQAGQVLGVSNTTILNKIHEYQLKS